MSRIQDGDIAWAPPLSFGLRKSLDIALLSQLGNLTQMHKSPGAGTLSTTGSTAGGTMIPGIISAGGEVPGGSLGVASQLSVATLEALLKAKGGRKSKMPTKNQWFHQVLFGEYKDREVGGKKIASRAVREAIREGKLPPLPLSKVEGKEMCLASHT